ncbi:unnamed protein product [Ostreobium quekettii]|uniref:Sugar phosphate transporter domain-containing protein n=1 Tax=Ostreobium quekettii TaxID=121088 RepID=A0A8S1JBV3_9CHLO|nr:unnamed protein product [Ostreobium quekettii]
MLSSQIIAPLAPSAVVAARRGGLPGLKPAGAAGRQAHLQAHRDGASPFLPAAPGLRLRRPSPVVVADPAKEVVATRAAAEELQGLDGAAAKVFGPTLAPSIVTSGFITMWYALNVVFNLTNKSIFKFFPYPWTVSTVHVLVGSIYCLFTYSIGLKQASFGRVINKEEFKKISGPAIMHAIGHIAANVSFAAVAISLTHTVKTLEPAFNSLLSWIITGQATPFPVVLSLVPIMGGVALASAAELSFNWLGFGSAMLSNITFAFRAVWGKGAIKSIPNLDSTAVYAYTTLISVFFCLPLALIIEGPTLKAGAKAAIAKVGAQTFYTSLLAVGLFYHLYNQFAFNTLGRVNPVSHGVCNVVKRVVIIGTSVVFFGNILTTQTKIGTAIALFGTYLYVEAQKRFKAPPPPQAEGAAA